jgi:hypothetical protein
MEQAHTTTLRTIQKDVQRSAGLVSQHYDQKKSVSGTIEKGVTAVDQRPRSDIIIFLNDKKRMQHIIKSMQSPKLQLNMSEETTSW